MTDSGRCTASGGTVTDADKEKVPSWFWQIFSYFFVGGGAIVEWVTFYLFDSLLHGAICWPRRCRCDRDVYELGAGPVAYLPQGG